MSTRRRAGFTLVELLVVIGIIALLISILLPALNKARDAATTVSCSSNLRTIGQLIANYSANNRGMLPAAVTWPNSYVEGGLLKARATGASSLSDLTANGYQTWSGVIVGKGLEVGDPAFGNENSLFNAFICPASPNRGVAACNTFPGNNDGGVSNEAGPGKLDASAPRISYMLNEAIAPRGRFAAVSGDTPVNSAYHYVVAGKVRNAASTIAASENWGIQNLMLTGSQNSANSGKVSNARRPVNGFSVSRTNTVTPNATPSVADAEKFVNTGTPDRIKPVTIAQLGGNIADPSSFLTPPSPLDTSLFFVGRVHGGRKTLGTISDGTTTINGFDKRKSNFLYVDGHVETKSLDQTIFPSFEWGQRFYSIGTN